MSRTFRLDLTGQTFGDWRVLGVSHKNEYGAIYWMCLDTTTGEKRSVRAANLTGGLSKSAGHRQRRAVTIHGMNGTPTHKAWENMKQRCLNPNHRSYKDYGGRGIKVHEPWLHSFEQFLADMGVRPEGKSLDREETNGDYTPKNCRWATSTQQLRNRRDTVRITHNGRTQTAYDWADETGLSARVIRSRISAGWSAEKALTTPVNLNLSHRR